jgi:peptidoglycan hydrolase-like protein with peptidoglycan-binding domain
MSEEYSRPSFLKAEGLSVGAEGEEVMALQLFLGSLGYLNVPGTQDKKLQRISTVSSLASPQEGVFDKITQRAVRRYQLFHALPLTGELDLSTLAMLAQPRCGFPDVLVLDTDPWPQTHLTYRLINTTPDLPAQSVQIAIAEAFKLWSDVTPLTFTAVGSGGDIQILFARGQHGDSSPFDGRLGVLAHAFYPTDGDAHFDEDEDWVLAVPPPTNTFDLISVAAHEFGHSLGLSHSSDPGALMYPTMSPAGHRFLATEDARRIQALYGPPGSTTLVVDKLVMRDTPQSGTWLFCFTITAGKSATFHIPNREYEGDNLTIDMGLRLHNVANGANVSFRVHLDDDESDVCSGRAEDQSSGSFRASVRGSQAFAPAGDWHYEIFWHLE